jgi:carbamate kinase
MGPKIEAAVEFVSTGGKEAVIGSLARLRETLEGASGTRITA